jgi:hypothetical protein
MDKSKIITNEMLVEKFLTSPLENYFYAKLKNEEPSYIKLKLCELIKFLLLSQNYFGNIPFNNEIDEMWHLWILQTIQYQELMDKLPSKRFIHHCSNDYHDTTHKSENGNCKEIELHNQFSCLVSYIENFGEFTKGIVKFWPLTIKLMNTMKLDLIALNYFLRKSSLNNS